MRQEPGGGNPGGWRRPPALRFAGVGPVGEEVTNSRRSGELALEHNVVNAPHQKTHGLRVS